GTPVVRVRVDGDGHARIRTEVLHLRSVVARAEVDLVALEDVTHGDEMRDAVGARGRDAANPLPADQVRDGLRQPDNVRRASFSGHGGFSSRAPGDDAANGSYGFSAAGFARSRGR